MNENKTTKSFKISKGKKQNEDLLRILKSYDTIKREQIIVQLIKGIKYTLKNYIYKNYDFLRSNIDDALKDTIQEAYIRLYENLEKENFTLKNSLESYFLGICKNYLREEARTYQKVAKPSSALPEQRVDIEIIFDQGDTMINLELYHQVLERLTGACKEVISFKYNKILEDGKARTSKEVADFFNFTLAYARVRVAECRKKLYELISHHNSC